MATQETTPATTESQKQASSQPETKKHSSNPFSKALNYMRAQADSAGAKRWEGASYLTAPGPEPQQRYPKRSKKSKEPETK